MSITGHGYSEEIPRLNADGTLTTEMNDDAWDAITIVNIALGQIWSEMLAVDCPDLDDTKEVVPNSFVGSFQRYAGSRLLNRIADRIMESEGF